MLRVFEHGKSNVCPAFVFTLIYKLLYHIEPYDVEARISENYIKTMPPDALALYVTRPSAAIVLPIQEKNAFGFYEEWFHIPISSQCKN